ncbi:MAG TPA: hypothetical protein PLB91_06910 [Spirochaetales bacterium]|nr:hypothetical protein [Spirochaetales bacterium]HRY52992.1 hypothetical protein [Spirochaetia bacterium]
MSEYIRVKDNKMLAAYCGPLPKGTEYRKVPDGWPHFVPGLDVRNFDTAWSLRPLADRIAEGLVVVSEAEVVEGETIRAMTQLERYRDGLDTLPPGKKVVETTDGTLSLEPMTRAEQVAAGQLTAQVAYSLDLADCEVLRKAAYIDEADPIYMMAARGEINETTGAPYTLEDWKNKVAEIKKRYPKPTAY